MLLEFSVEGFTSIGENQTLTFNAFLGQRIKGSKYQDNYVDSKFREAKSTIIFGGNAVGKTNLLVAINGLIECIKTGALITNKRLFNHNYRSMILFHTDLQNKGYEKGKNVAKFIKNHNGSYEKGKKALSGCNLLYYVKEKPNEKYTLNVGNYTL